ncbi:MAG: hypothetical protein WAO76_09720 [Georgfuchsia sp.]
MRNKNLILHRRQQGVTLLIALIMLVSMTLAGIVMFRQIGTGIIIARNLTFRQSATTAADRGIEAARTWLVAQGAGALEQPIIAQGYYPAWCNVSVDASNVPDEDEDGTLDNCGAEPPPSTFVPATYNWANSVQAIADDGAGNRVQYVIHRLCRIPGGINVSSQQCVTIGSVTSGGSHGSASYGTQALTNTMQPYFRITARVTGPMNTVVYTQTMIY